MAHGSSLATLAPCTPEQAFPANSASVGAARRFVVGVLGTWGHGAAVWVASLLESEFATNAVLHAGTPFTVSVSVHDGAVRLEVGDGVRRAHQDEVGDVVIRRHEQQRRVLVV